VPRGRVRGAREGEETEGWGGGGRLGPDRGGGSGGRGEGHLAEVVGALGGVREAAVLRAAGPVLVVRPAELERDLSPRDEVSAGTLAGDAWGDAWDEGVVDARRRCWMVCCWRCAGGWRGRTGWDVVAVREKGGRV
jgi:hypothetical protein